MSEADADDRGAHRYAVVVAGGSGTRLWPLSRERLPKQIQTLTGEKSLIAETVERLQGVVPSSQIFVSTTRNYADPIQAQLPAISPDNFIVEPEAHGTSAAFALFAEELFQRDPSAVVFSLASDHKVTEVDRFQDTMRECYLFVEAHPEQIALVGIKPTRPDPELGYIKARRTLVDTAHNARAVEKFIEKPRISTAAVYLTSDDYYWNAAYYCFTAKTLLEAYDDADPSVVDAIRRYRASDDPADYLTAPQKVHEIEFIDSGKYPLAVIPAEFAWSDIGNWHSLIALLEHEDTAGTANDPSLYVNVASENCRVRATGDRVVVTVGVDGASVFSNEDGLIVRLGKSSIIIAPRVALVLDEDHHHQLPVAQQLLRDRNKGDYL
jgi:mannose-1-phosphate guanylyltransferase